VDNARVAYARFGELFAGERWEALAAKGAQVQRVLWASTGTKNPAYPDTMYVDELIGPATVNTVPPKTLDAFIDHGTVARTVDRDLDGARARLNALAALAIDVDDITADLQRAGVASFASAFESLLASIDAKRAAL
jgi:transaldolase